MARKFEAPNLNLETRVVNGVELECQQFAPRMALKLIWDIGRSAPFVIARLEGKMDAAHVVAAIQETLIRLSSDEFEELYMRILKGTTAKVGGELVSLGDPVMVDRVFEGNMEGLCNAIAFAMEVNFAGFINGALATWMPRASAPKAKAS